MWKKWKDKILRRNNRDLEKWEINQQEMKELVKKGVKLIDVRSPQEYREGHFDGAILLPEYEIKKQAKQVLPNPEEEIIVYCLSGHRSKKAQQELHQLGYQKVYHLTQGMLS